MKPWEEKFNELFAHSQRNVMLVSHSAKTKSDIIEFIKTCIRKQKENCLNATTEIGITNYEAIKRAPEPTFNELDIIN